MLWTILLFVITISLLVTVHEFGHFWVARRCGVQVDCFSIGFGKKIWTYRTKQGTEFAISMIPLGGYVKMLNSKERTLSSTEQHLAFDFKPIWKRAAIVSAGPIANFILAFIVYWIIFQLGIVSYPVKIGQILPETPAATINIPVGAELKTISDIKVESWADVNSVLVSSMGNKKLPISYVEDANFDNEKKVLINREIDISNWRFDLERTSAITALGIVPALPTIYPVLSHVVTDSAAERAGLNVGDEIIGYNGQEYTDWADLVAQIHKAELIELKVKRNNAILDIELIPSISMDDQGREKGVAGFSPTIDTVTRQYDVISALGKSLHETGFTIKLTVRSFYQLITGKIELKHLSGPITIARTAEQSASYGFVPYLYFLAFISISLGVINLVPLPMLDGGHLIFLLIEKIRGQALSEQAMANCYRVSLFLLMLIMSIALVNDFLRLL